ncbi:hypothetical protein [Phaeobacter piscinae]|uniref:hypothetical protein n=1 Tax=Phaeobacter piscinae TaxID=1580596 RepID=UPI00058CA4DD|nr:hypothetical protein [Phaeobacter piscinae]UTS79548.1 hypothetical protein OL67_000595 [Phaeobacter piscinae]
MKRREIIDAALGAYENACTWPHYTDDQRVSARSAVRDMMVRLDLYDEFLEAQGIMPSKYREGGHAVS